MFSLEIVSRQHVVTRPSAPSAYIESLLMQSSEIESSRNRSPSINVDGCYVRRNSEDSRKTQTLENRSLSSRRTMWEMKKIFIAHRVEARKVFLNSNWFLMCSPSQTT